MKRKAILLISIFTLGNFLLWLVDKIFGDGDGVIAAFNYHPLLFGLISLLALGLIILTTHKNLVLSNIGLVLGSLLLALCLGEVLLNFVLPKQGNAETIILEGGAFQTKFDTTFFKNYIPGSKFKTRLLMDDMDDYVINEINSLGIRGPEILEKEDSTYRYVFVGDSYLQCDEIIYDSIVGQQVGKLLGHGYEVIQHGIPSWSPLLEWNWAIKMRPQLKMDGVILFLYYNDFIKGDYVGDTGYTKYCVFNEDHVPVKFDFSGVNKGESTLIKIKNRLRSSRVVQLMTQNQETLFQFDLPPSQLLTLDSASYNSIEKPNSLMSYLQYGLIDLCRDTSQWDLKLRSRVDTTLDYLSGFSRWCDRENIDFAIALIPTPFQLEGEGMGYKKDFGFPEDFILPRGGLVDYLQQFSETNDIPFISLLDHYRSLKEDHQLLYFNYDLHWNNYGHRVTADGIHRFLSTNYTDRDE